MEGRRSPDVSPPPNPRSLLGLLARVRTFEALVLFRDYRLIEPGLVLVPEWRPDEPADPDLPPIGFYGGVARKDG